MGGALDRYLPGRNAMFVNDNLCNTKSNYSHSFINIH